MLQLLGNATAMALYLLNLVRFKAIFENDAQGCPNRCLQFLKATNVYY